MNYELLMDLYKIAKAQSTAVERSNIETENWECPVCGADSCELRTYKGNVYHSLNSVVEALLADHLMEVDTREIFKQEISKGFRKYLPKSKRLAQTEGSNGFNLAHNSWVRKQEQARRLFKFGLWIPFYKYSDVVAFTEQELS